LETDEDRARRFAFAECLRYSCSVEFFGTLREGILKGKRIKKG